MFRFKHFLFSILILLAGALLTACGNQQKQTQPVNKLALVKSGQGHQARVWYHFSQDQTQVTRNSAVNGIFILKNGKATTYMLPTGKNKVTLRQVSKMPTPTLLKWAKNQDRKAFQTGVSAQQTKVKDSIDGIKTDLKRLQASKSDPTQVKALQQYLKINEAIHDNPSNYAAPSAYPLTANQQARGEQFGLKLYPVKTVQYGDANVIMASELSLSNYTFNKRIQPTHIDGHYYGGYSSTVNDDHYLILTRVTKHTRIVYDQQKTAGVSKPTAAE
ncbi:hypothetical protein HC026_00350 [Lactobacillus sp. LC28-10]|uniref:Lipoprotein n=1 Tax=Secundilactobacillus angelensis TaxID=2722706 RepID=A0ABX1KZ78_9LACO|nr:hypothetical protein [Secundilactobacillus angelensis]MCH5461874.1 hypothetical protein [Secundilactobacillus angelensis]NLR17361.1 hypothetical protein [Secundilactobacillus angelensis]